MNTESIQKLAKKLQALSGKCQFASFVYKSKSSGEVARFTFALGAKYIELLRESVTELETMPEPADELEKKALENVRASTAKSLAAHEKGEQSESYTKRGQYLHIAPNLQLNLVDNTLEICGKLHSKVVLVEGTRKEVNSRPLTIAQDRIKKTLPVSKWRSLAIDDIDENGQSRLETAKINGETIEF